MSLNISCSKILFFTTIFCFMGCNKRSERKYIDFTYEKILEISFDSVKYLSSCIVDENLYIVSNIANIYYFISLETHQIIKKQFPVEIENPSSIFISDKNIIVSDLVNRSLTFFDLDMKYKKRVILNRFPLKVRIYKNDAYYLTDLLSDSLYRFSIIKENLQSHKEEILFIGDSINVMQLRNRLNMNSPKTLCYDIYEDQVYVASQRYDAKRIYEIESGKMKKIFMEDKEWTPKLYTDNEKEMMLTRCIDVLSKIKYPKSQIELSHKISINSISVDKNGNIWILSPNVENSIIISVYSLFGIKEKEFVIKGGVMADILLYQNYFVLYDVLNLKHKLVVYEIVEVVDADI